MPAAVDLNYQFSFSTEEIGEIGSDRMLTNKFETTELSVLKLDPKKRFRQISTRPEFSRPPSRAFLSPRSTFLGHSPSPVRCANHLSPAGGGEETAPHAWSSSTISAPLQPVMIEAALVLPDILSGKIEASMTRNP